MSDLSTASLSAPCQTAAAALQGLFETIYTQRMQEMPIINPHLRVETVGFQAWQGDCLGVLITPWFMNLVILPHVPADELKIGQKLLFAFPVGEYEFVVNAESPIGFFYSCSLFSPMFEFSDHASAHATAEAIIELLFKPELPASTPELASSAAAKPAETAPDISRRDLLRGRLR